METISEFNSKVVRTPSRPRIGNPLFYPLPQKMEGVCIKWAIVIIHTLSYRHSAHHIFYIPKNNNSFISNIQILIH